VAIHLTGLKAWLQQTLAKAGYRAVPVGRYRDGLFTAHQEAFRHEPAFAAAYARGITASSGVDPGIEWRVSTALWAASTALHTQGDFVECGVNAGFISSTIMQDLDWRSQADRTFYLVDTFAGPVWEQFSSAEIASGQRRASEDAAARGAYVTDLERIRANFAEWPNARIVPGAIPEVLDQIASEAIAFLHIDMNCAYPEQAALKHLWSRLSRGAVVLLDDYAYLGLESQHAAISETAAELGVAVLALPTGQGIIIKP
jgi:Macrocin-O-methyltransferase (TylF)